GVVATGGCHGVFKFEWFVTQAVQTLSSMPRRRAHRCAYSPGTPRFRTVVERTRTASQNFGSSPDPLVNRRIRPPPFRGRSRDLHRLGRYQLGQDRAPPTDVGYRQLDILARHRVHEVVVLRRTLPLIPVASTAGRILASSPVSLPSCTLSMAPLIAPHAVCPITSTTFAPATLQANSMLPRMSSLAMLPATRALNTSPVPRSMILPAG